MSIQWLLQRQRTTNLGQIIDGTASILAVVGFGLSVQVYLNDRKKSLDEALDAKAHNCLCRTEKLGYERNPAQLLFFIEQYRSELQRESSWFYGGPDLRHTGSWADRWVYERNSGRYPRAKRIEKYRVDVKGVFWSAMKCWEENSERRESMTDIFLDEPLNRSLAAKFIELVEPLDKARCRSHDTCVWEKDAPRIYEFLRQMYQFERPRKPSL